jgi:SHS2 domain-containing protein
VRFSGEYQYTDEDAGGDIGFTARGSSLPELFTACWTAALNAMVRDPDSVRGKVKKTLSLRNTALDMLLHDFLQELVYLKDAEDLFLRAENIRFRDESGSFALSCDLRGERIDPSRHERLLDVKGVTFYRFSVARTGGGWEARVVLDV